MKTTPDNTFCDDRTDGAAMTSQRPVGFWTETKLDDLRELWPQNLTVVEIGIRLGCSKGTVSGKALRLGLPAKLMLRRASRAPAVAKAPRPVKLDTKPRQQPRQPPRRPKRALPPALPQQRASSPARQCLWLDGDGRQMRQCEAERVGHGPYCPHHGGLAYQTKSGSRKPAMDMTA